MAPIPVVLVGRSFWSRAVDFDYLVGEGYIEPRDSVLFTCVDEAEEVVAALEQFHRGQEPAGAPTRCASATWLSSGGPGECGVLPRGPASRSEKNTFELQSLMR